MSVLETDCLHHLPPPHSMLWRMTSLVNAPVTETTNAHDTKRQKRRQVHDTSSTRVRYSYHSSHTLAANLDNVKPAIITMIQAIESAYHKPAPPPLTCPFSLLDHLNTIFQWLECFFIHSFEDCCVLIFFFIIAFNNQPDIHRTQHFYEFIPVHAIKL